MHYIHTLEHLLRSSRQVKNKLGNFYIHSKILIANLDIIIVQLKVVWFTMVEILILLRRTF